MLYCLSAVAHAFYIPGMMAPATYNRIAPHLLVSRCLIQKLQRWRDNTVICEQSILRQERIAI